ncbi:MAG: redoxin domain-containing protein [Planctomycetota bacterium]|nr:redoxin domain-containing protein [Planctomycetota bacterium]
MRIPANRRSITGLPTGAIIKLSILVGFLLTSSCPISAQEPGAKPAEDEKVPEGHSYHGEAFNEGPRQSAYLMKGTGGVSFPVTTEKAEVQAFINQGVGQLHGFWYFEAERSFRQAAALDPKLAMSYWGMAMANPNNEKRARQFIEEAEKLKADASERERMYIGALKGFLDAGAKKDKGGGKKNDREKKRRENYLDALDRIIQKFPVDLEARAFLVCHMWQSSWRGVRITSHVAVDALIDQILKESPMHPAHHYRIHLWDNEEPGRALASAARNGQASPSIAHMWHMGGHIFSKLKRYDDAAWQQEASARVDHAQMMKDLVLPDQIHNFAHNNEWLIRNLMYVGRVGEALSLAKNMIELPRHPKYNTLRKGGSSTNYGRRRLFEVLHRFELWDQLIGLSRTRYLPPTEIEDEQVKRLRHLGTAYVRNRDTENGISILISLKDRLDVLEGERDGAVKAARDSESAKLEKERAGKKEGDKKEGDKKEGDKKEGDKKAEEARVKEEKKRIDEAAKKAGNPYRPRIERARKAVAEIEGHLALLQGDLSSALGKFREAGGVNELYLAKIEYQLAPQQKEDAAAEGKAEGKAEEKEDKKIKTRTREKILEWAQGHVDGRKGQVLAIAGYIELLLQAGQREKAQEEFEILRALSGRLDLETPVFRRLIPLARELGYKPDWRIEYSEPGDVGNRPSLDSLGPFRWQPSKAAPWKLKDYKGAERSLAGYKGRPLVIVFYLGYGCIHCAEQLNAFAPRIEDFKSVGLDVVAISSNNQEDLKKSLDAYEKGDFPFPLVANPELDVFKAYRAYDDFEDLALHGTYLIDEKGSILWHDISYEPFMDPDFVINEWLRLSGRSRPASLDRRKKL